jgi:hypothetical protein
MSYASAITFAVTVGMTQRRIVAVLPVLITVAIFMGFVITNPINGRCCHRMMHNRCWLETWCGVTWCCECLRQCRCCSGSVSWFGLVCFVLGLDWIVYFLGVVLIIDVTVVFGLSRVQVEKSRE